MCTNDSYVSPYLLQPRRSYAEVMRDSGETKTRTICKDGGLSSEVTPNRADDEDVPSGIPKRDPRREGEARLQPRLYSP